MSNHPSRRDFIKLSSSLLFLYGMNYFQQSEQENPPINTNKKNILIVVFDTLSATNMSLYGYPRKTTPILESILENATVYQNHYASGNWTTPGTGSLLTGVYPWSHRAIRQAASIHPFFEKRIYLVCSMNTIKSPILITQPQISICANSETILIYTNLSMIYI